MEWVQFNTIATRQYVHMLLQILEEKMRLLAVDQTLPEGAARKTLDP
jgi:hypothetical protein